MKVLKRIGKISLIVLLVIIGVIGTFTVYHHIALAVEKGHLKNPGQLVTVDGKKMNIYIQGESTNPTMIFISGAGTAAPIYNFKPLTSVLSEQYQTVVVERFGYGYSDIVKKSRSIDSILADTRAALSAAGVTAPYILLPHSMGGLEALYWAQKYPAEISAIIGLDMAIPESYDSLDFKKEKSQIDTARFLKFFGLSRLMGSSNGKAGLSKSEISQQNKLAHRNFVNGSLYNEGLKLLDNAKTVKDGGVPNVQMLLFSSNGKDIDSHWLQKQREFATENGFELIEYDCGHYIHQHKATEIVEKIIAFFP